MHINTQQSVLKSSSLFAHVASFSLSCIQVALSFCLFVSLLSVCPPRRLSVAPVFLNYRLSGMIWGNISTSEGPQDASAGCRRVQMTACAMNELSLLTYQAVRTSNTNLFFSNSYYLLFSFNFFGSRICYQWWINLCAVLECNYEILH